MYYSLRATTISKEVAEQHKDEKVYIERAHQDVEEIIIEPEKQPETNIFEISNEVNITLATENGYFEYDNRQIKIKKRSANEVIFFLPYGVEQVNVKVKEGGEVVTKSYVAK